MSSKDFLVWLDKYHPKTFFGSWESYDQIVDPRATSLYGNVVGFDVWVPAKEDNSNWRLIPGSGYAAFNPRLKTLPIAISQKKIEKWLRVSDALLLVKAPGDT